MLGPQEGEEGTGEISPQACPSSITAEELVTGSAIDNIQTLNFDLDDNNFLTTLLKACQRLASTSASDNVKTLAEDDALTKCMDIPLHDCDDPACTPRIDLPPICEITTAGYLVSVGLLINPLTETAICRLRANAKATRTVMRHCELPPPIPT